MRHLVKTSIHKLLTIEFTVLRYRKKFSRIIGIGTPTLLIFLLIAFKIMVLLVKLNDHDFHLHSGI